MSTVLSVVLIISRLAYVNGGPTCDSMEPICASDGLSFSVVHHDGSVAEDGPNYDCLGDPDDPSDRPDPAWFYLKISTAGNISMELTAPEDIDFIIYGPYDDVPYAQAKCARMGQNETENVTEIVDCSFSGTNHETPEIIGAELDRIYVMLITNYAEITQNISLVSTNISTGATDCGILPTELPTESPTVGTASPTRATTSPTRVPTTFNPTEVPTANATLTPTAQITTTEDSEQTCGDIGEKCCFGRECYSDYAKCKRGHCRSKKSKSGSSSNSESSSDSHDNVLQDAERSAGKGYESDNGSQNEVNYNVISLLVIAIVVGLVVMIAGVVIWKRKSATETKTGHTVVNNADYSSDEAMEAGEDDGNTRLQVVGATDVFN